MISVHPNGFLQIEIDEDSRINVFDKSIRRQKVRTPIHDHRFGFISLVQYGTLINVRFKTVETPAGKYRIHECVPGENGETMLRPTGVRVDLVKTAVETLKPYQSYVIQPREFHMTQHLGLTVTKMIKTTDATGVARVLVPVDKKPDNSFKRVRMGD